MRKKTDYVKTCKEFKEVFGLDFRKYIDTDFLVLGDISIDIFAFDDWLTANHECNELCSMKDVVMKVYGQRGVELIEDLM